MRHDPLILMRQSASQARALRAELARQAATPRGQAQLDVERLQAQFSEQEKQRGASAMTEAKRIQSSNPGIPIGTALLMAGRVIANRAGDGLTLEDVMRLAETMSPEELERKFAKDYADDPHALVHAHHLAGMALRVQKASSRVPELKAEVRKLKVQYPGHDTHWYHAVAASNLGIK